ncbi:hypothetical protein [uncultured Dialister sp.]|jgi:hypothetical protein|uniref:hypothetical protein n=1 Tax=uncultured Dialister sp. TaxID=278064 RepID=UPI0025EAAF95|nr:hypothetical protein [uncultured Dialister sp.]
MSIKKTATLLALSLILLSGSAGAAASAPPTGTGIGMWGENFSASGIVGTALPSGLLPGVFPGVGPVIGGQAGESPAISGSGTSVPVDEIPSDEMTESFLNGKVLPKTMKYQPLSKDRPSLGTYGGVLTVKGTSYTAGALAVSAVFKGPKSDAYFGGMFLPGGYSRQAGEKMLAFNMTLLKLESITNDVFLKTVGEARKDTGTQVPYDFLAVDMLHVEQLHKVNDHPKVYSFSLRPAFSVDGWVIPLFFRGYAAKVDNSYRFLLLASPDSEKDLVSQAGLRLVGIH